MSRAELSALIFLRHFQVIYIEFVADHVQVVQ